MTYTIFLIEALRDTKFYSAPFIRVRDLIVGVDGGFRTFEEMQRKEEAA